MNKLSLFDKYYNLGIKAINEINEQYVKNNISENKIYMTQKTIEALKIDNVDLDRLSWLKVSIPRYRYRYRDLDGNLLRSSDINYNELAEAVKLGTVVREPKFHKYVYMKLYLVDIGDRDLGIYSLRIENVLKELDCISVSELCDVLEKRYKFTCKKDIKNYLNNRWDIDLDEDKEEETLYLINLLSKISERVQFVDMQEELLEERVIRLVCDCNALEVREKIQQGAYI